VTPEEIIKAEPECSEHRGMDRQCMYCEYCPDCMKSRIAKAIAAETQRCAKVAEGVRGGYSANIRVSEDEQEFVKDPDGPWVLNSEVAAAIRQSRKM